MRKCLEILRLNSPNPHRYSHWLLLLSAAIPDTINKQCHIQDLHMSDSITTSLFTNNVMIALDIKQGRDSVCALMNTAAQCGLWTVSKKLKWIHYLLRIILWIAVCLCWTADRKESDRKSGERVWPNKVTYQRWKTRIQLITIVFKYNLFNLLMEITHQTNTSYLLTSLYALKTNTYLLLA